MKMTDLADVLAPKCERTIIGIRPGEKLHEVLDEINDVYVVLKE